MKKALLASLSLAMALSLSACGGTATDSKPAADTAKEEKASEKDTEEDTEKKSHDVKDIDLTYECGNLKFLGAEKVDSVVLKNNPELEADKSVFLKFQFSSFMDDPERPCDVFFIDAYQNSVEIDALGSCTLVQGNEQSDLLENKTKNVLKDGTINYGIIMKLQDDSPIQVRATPLSGDSDGYQMMELNVADILNGKDVNVDTGNGSLSAQDVESQIQGTWLNNGGTMTFDNGNLVMSNQGQTMNMTYEVKADEKNIIASMTTSEGKEMYITIPYIVENGKVAVMNNNGDVLQKQ